MCRTKRKTAPQRGTPAGHIHSKGASLSGHCDPGPLGPPHFSTKPSPCLSAGLSLPDEGGSEGEDEYRKYS